MAPSVFLLALFQLGGPWIDSWKLDGIFAGIPGQGAEDAWWLTSFTIEVARLSGSPLSGGAIDILKCFDQISRVLLKTILLLAGFPSDILNAYLRFHDQLRVLNLLAGGYGKPFQKTFSIPQGCPFSMLFIAILLRPIILLTEVPGTIMARILADDVLIMGMGSNHVPVFTQAYDKLLTFIEDMGSKVSIKKSYLFSTDADIRQFLKDFQWRTIKAKVGVISDIRDLGAHLNVSARHVGTTLTKRMLAALPKLRRLAWLPLQMSTKASLALIGIFSGGLYGCKATHASETHLSSLSSVLANSLHGDAPRRSSACLFNLLDVEVEPWAVVCLRRITLMRRLIIKNPWLQESVAEAIQLYLTKGFPGTTDDTHSPMDIPFAPSPGSPSRRQWNTLHHAYGPVGFLLYSLSHFDLALSPELRLHQVGEPTIDIISMPAQYVKPHVTLAIRRGRLQQDAKERTALGNHWDLDLDVMRCALDSLDASHLPAVRWVITLSFWDNQLLHSLGHRRDGLCSCGEPHTLEHWLWECPRTQDSRDLVRHNNSAFRHGFAPSMSSNPLDLPWLPQCPITMDQLQDLVKVCGYNIKFDDRFVKAQAFHVRHGSDYTLNARQLIAKFRGDLGTLHLHPWQTHQIHGDDFIEAWTDGGLSSPDCQQWGLGGAGLFIDDCNLDIATQAPDLHTYAHHHPDASMIRVFTPVPGPFCSSTRTEIIGIILALCVPLHLDVASDSANVVKTLGLLIANVDFRPGKPWGLMSNGDLWQVVQQLVKQRGANNIKIRKVKGHADDTHLNAGITSAKDLRGNNISDDLATEGREAHGSELHCSASLCELRHRVYAKVIESLYSHIGRCMALDNELRDSPKPRKRDFSHLGPPLGIIPSLPPHPERSLSEPLSTACSFQDAPTFSKFGPSSV